MRHQLFIDRGWKKINKKVSQTSQRKAPAKQEGTRRRIYRIESTNGKAAEDDDDDESRQKKRCVLAQCFIGQLL